MFPIFIAGTPRPQGSKSVTRRGVMYEANPHTKAWRAAMQKALTAAIANQRGAWEPMDGPLSISATFWILRPKRPKFPLPATPADLDKYQRALGDALTTSGVITDDSRLTTWHAEKRYSETPGVTIHRIEPDQGT